MNIGVPERSQKQQNKENENKGNSPRASPRQSQKGPKDLKVSVKDAAAPKDPNSDIPLPKKLGKK